MRLVASSKPGAVERDGAIYLLTERAVLTRAVCRELQESAGDYGSRRPRAALTMLLQWIWAYFPKAVRVSPRALDGLDGMVVPDDCKSLLEEIRAGVLVCEDLFMLTTADSGLDWDQDMKSLKKSLTEYWRAHRKAVKPPGYHVL